MKGLFIKDLRLMKTQKRFFLLILIVSVFISLTSEDSIFVAGYLTFVIPMFALSTISYDEFENGYSFLFTLPITKKEYVIEKYLFSGALSLAATAVGSLITLGFLAFRDPAIVWESLLGVPAVWAMTVVFMSFMIPLQLKFGAEKSRIAMIVAVGILMAVIYAMGGILKKSGLDAGKLLEGLLSADALAVVLSVLVLIAVILVLSVIISISIMKKKQF